ncbi:MAG: hypothetical protein OEZ30_05315 [Candidatus Aminicenantes bacterium]|nr:hypothetical protein [Candidatus Aminicenantes bacterium]MDH5714963.1 hypothetical protein [Candidatus Aminicenantes bacterium]
MLAKKLNELFMDFRYYLLGKWLRQSEKELYSTRTVRAAFLCRYGIIRVQKNHFTLFFFLILL